MLLVKSPLHFHLSGPRSTDLHRLLVSVLTIVAIFVLLINLIAVEVVSNLVLIFTGLITIV